MFYSFYFLDFYVFVAGHTVTINRFDHPVFRACVLLRFLETTWIPSAQLFIN